MIDRLRINEYLEDISQQLKDLKKLAIPDVEYCAVLGLRRPTDDTADAIIALGQEDIIPIGFAYLPSEFDPHKLYENLQRLDDFRKFSHYIVDFLETEEQHENP